METLLKISIFINYLIAYYLYRQPDFLNFYVFSCWAANFLLSLTLLAVYIFYQLKWRRIKCTQQKI